jgi:hypothetical protein
MQLKLKGNVDHRVPRGIQVLGQFPTYWGLSRTESGEYEPCEFTIDSDDPAAQRLLKLARRDGCFGPVDEPSASMLGVTLPSQPVPERIKKAQVSQ